MTNQEQKTILLVEDETTTMLVETHQLKSFGYDVVTAKSGEEAVQIATGNDQIALVLMDIELSSGMDGAEAARQILGKRHLPIVFLTVHTDKEYVGRIKGIAGYGCVIKNSGDVVLHSSIEMAFNLFEADAAMRAISSRQQALLTTIPEIIVEVDKNKVFTWVNSAGLEFYGEDVLGKEAAFYFEGEQDTYSNVAPLFGGSEDVIYVESWQRRKDGEKRLLAWWCRVLKDGSGNVIGAISTARDITERKVSEQKLIELKDIINRSGSLVFIWRVEPDKWPVEFVSENVENITGYSVEDFISGRVEWPAITHPDDVPRLEKEVAQYLEKGVRQWSQEYRLITKSGEVRWFRDDNLALEDSAGKIIRIQAVIHNITEHKKAEERLKRFNRVAVGQELEMVRLEEEVNALLEKSGLPRKYETPEKIKKPNESNAKV